jgi:hypothetical protein
MAGEATAALIAALKQSDGRHHSGFQALMTLSRKFNSLMESEQAIVMGQIDRLGHSTANSLT